jgi:hypothetical protein
MLKVLKIIITGNCNRLSITRALEPPIAFNSEVVAPRIKSRVELVVGSMFFDRISRPVAVTQNLYARKA